MSSRSRSTRLVGLDANTATDTMMHLWTWREGGKEQAFALAARKAKR